MDTFHNLNILRNLSMRNCTISTAATGALKHLISSTHSLEKLDLSYSKLTPKGTVLISESLCTNTFLKELEMYSCRSGFNSETVQTFAAMLKANQSLTRVNIANCNISDDGTEYLADGLINNKTLKQLNMSDNQVGDNGTIAMATALLHNKTLKQLNISRNPVGDSGAIAMAEVLKNNTTLKQLHMDQDSYVLSLIGEEGVKALIDSLELNQHLLILTLPKRFSDTLPSHHQCMCTIKFGW